MIPNSSVTVVPSMYDIDTDHQGGNGSDRYSYNYNCNYVDRETDLEIMFAALYTAIPAQV